MQAELPIFGWDHLGVFATRIPAHWPSPQQEHEPIPLSPGSCAKNFQLRSWLLQLQGGECPAHRRLSGYHAAINRQLHQMLKAYWTCLIGGHCQEITCEL